MVQIKWTPQAISDLEGIAKHISLDSTHYAKLQVLKLKKRVEILKQQPYVGSPVPEFNRRDLRQLLQGRYRIIYKTVNETQVDILTVHHSSRDFLKRFE